MNWQTITNYLSGKGQNILKDFNPSPVYRDQTKRFNRNQSPLSKTVGQAVSYGDTSWPVETYGIDKSKPGDYVIAFTGANSGEGSSNSWENSERMLTNRYGRGSFAAFTPRQLAQAQMFVDALPKGSRIHITGHSQGAGAAIRFLNNLKNKPNDFVHSVHLYDAVRDQMTGDTVYPTQYQDRIKHFIPSLLTPFKQPDQIALAGGRYGNIEGVQNIPVPGDHHYIFNYGGEIPVQDLRLDWPVNIPETVEYPLSNTPISKLSRFDLATVVPKDHPVTPSSTQQIAKVYNPMTNSTEPVLNVNGEPGLGRMGTGQAASFSLTDPNSYLRNFGIKPQLPGKESFSTFYRDPGVHNILSTANTGNEFSNQFFNIVDNITSPNNPSKFNILMKRISPADLEKSIGDKIEAEITTLLDNQTPRDAIFGYGYLMNNLQKDINKLYMTSQMFYLRGDNEQAKNYARASVLSQSVLNQLVPRVNQKIIQAQNEALSGGNNFKFTPPGIDWRTAARIYLTNSFKQPQPLYAQQ